MTRGRNSGGFRPSRHEREVVVANWQDAEELAAWHMRERLGIDGARTTGSGTDQGLDVVSRDSAAQVKHHAGQVGSPEIQRLRGAAFQRAFAAFYSQNGYTPAAVVVADETDIALFRYNVYGDVIPVNARATKALREAPEQLEQRMQARREAERASAIREKGKLAFVRFQLVRREAQQVRSAVDAGLGFRQHLHDKQTWLRRIFARRRAAELVSLGERQMTAAAQAIVNHAATLGDSLPLIVETSDEDRQAQVEMQALLDLVNAFPERGEVQQVLDALAELADQWKKTNATVLQALKRTHESG